MTAAQTVARPAAPSGRSRGAGPLVLEVPPGSLVVLAGLPGAGKTTLLRRLSSGRPPGVVAIDAEEVAARLRPCGVPYRLLRPLVHGLHLLRVLREVRTPATCVLTTDPMTSPVRRALLSAAARGSGRTLHVVLVDATAEQARLGQAGRGRALGHRRMARHVVRARRLRARLDAGHGMTGADGVLVLARTTAATVDGVAVRSTRLSLRQPRRRAA